MVFRANISILSLIAVCFCVVNTKNVDSLRYKRSATANGDTCENIKGFFRIKNMSLPAPVSSKGSICSGQCCDDSTEAQLRKQGQQDFAGLLRHNSRALQGLLSSTSSTLQGHMVKMAEQSENKTLLLFTNVYQRMAVYSKAPTHSFYSDIKRYIQVSRDANASLDIKESTERFFTDLFPLVYLHSLNNTSPGRDLSIDYKDCLRKSASDILPFGEIPKLTAQSLTKSLEATKLLFQSFSVGAEVLNATDAVLINENDQNNAECYNALLKMTYCPKCLDLGKHAKPCKGYCLNVLRGCLSKYVAELASPWNGYVEGVEKLVNAMKQHNNEAGVNADHVIRELDTRISEAIMHAMAKGKIIDTKVKKSCGLPKYSEKEDPLIVESTTLPSIIGKHRAAVRGIEFSPPPETQLLQFLTSIAKTRGFYGNLADILCEDETFAEPKDQKCWNGERIAEYSKPVVDTSSNAQKYNPEVKANMNIQSTDPRIADLADKLQKVHQSVMTSLGSNYGSEFDYMQGDSGIDGSGSGNGPDDNDSEDDYTRGSGSGHGPAGPLDPQQPKHDITPYDPVDPNPNNTPRTTHTKVDSGAITNKSSIFTLSVIVLTSIVVRHY